MQYLNFCAQLILLNITSSKSINVAANDRVSSFLWLVFLYSSVHTPWLIYSLGYCERCCREDDSTGVLGCADLLSFGEVFQHKGLNSSQGGQVPPLVQGRWGRSCRNVSPWARLRTGGHQRGGQDSVTLEGGKDATGRYHRSPSAQPPFPQLYP